MIGGKRFKRFFNLLFGRWAMRDKTKKSLAVISFGTCMFLLVAIITPLSLWFSGEIECWDAELITGTVNFVIFMTLFGGIGVTVANWLMNKYPEKASIPDIADVAKKISELNQIADTLRNLTEFIKRQKEIVQKEGEAIQTLFEQKADLEPVVAAGQVVVDKMFKLQRKRNKKLRIVDLIIGFVLGIVGSMIASSLMY